MFPKLDLSSTKSTGCWRRITASRTRTWTSSLRPSSGQASTTTSNTGWDERKSLTRNEPHGPFCGQFSGRDILRRLLALNLEIAAREAAGRSGSLEIKLDAV